MNVRIPREATVSSPPPGIGGCVEEGCCNAVCNVAYQANPGGEFFFPDNFQQIEPLANLAYRVVAQGKGGGCVGDIDGDGAVNPSDLIVLLGSWSVDPGSCPGCPADLDGDDDVDGGDLILLLGAWGPCP